MRRLHLHVALLAHVHVSLRLSRRAAALPRWHRHLCTVVSTPYRDQELSCPGRQAPLRLDGGRLCCDACGGVLAPVAELTAALADLTKLPLAIAFTHERAAEPRCPRCANAMTRCRIDVRFDKVHAHPWRSVLRCEPDGVWFPRDRFARFIALGERKARDEYKSELPGRPPGMFSMR